MTAIYTGAGAGAGAGVCHIHMRPPMRRIQLRFQRYIRPRWQIKTFPESHLFVVVEDAAGEAC